MTEEYLPELKIGQVVTLSELGPIELEITPELKAGLEFIAKYRGYDNARDAFQDLFSNELSLKALHVLKECIGDFYRVFEEITGLSHEDAIEEVKPYMGEDFLDKVTTFPEGLAEQIAKEILTPDLKG